MAAMETIEEVVLKEEFVFVDEYFPIDLQEEEVVAETIEAEDVVNEQREDNEEIMHATNSILPEGYDPLDPNQWTQEEVIIESCDDPTGGGQTMGVVASHHHHQQQQQQARSRGGGLVGGGGGGETVLLIKQEVLDEEMLEAEQHQEEVAIGGEQQEVFMEEEEEEQAQHVYECYKCARRFAYKDKLFKHMKLHHARGDDVMIERDGKRIWTCTQCDKTFISRKGSIIHQRTHTGERPYSCSVCQKRFIDSSTLMKHQVIHQATRPFTCVICHRGFNQKVALQRHERTHSQLQPTYKCKYCPKTFLVSSSLQAHEKIHSGIKPYTCQYCPSRFHTSTAQRQHERVHTNERPYACNYCPKAFKDSGTLFKHQVIHSGIRPFVCPICSQGFTQKVALRKHIRSHVSRHLGNNCEVCDNVYFNKEELCSHIEEHIEQHPSFTQVKTIATSSPRVKTQPLSPEPVEPAVKETGDLSDLATLCDVAISTAGDLAHSYPCLHCGMSFRRKKSLDCHLAIHRTTCKYCDRPFPDKASLESHERRLCGSGGDYTPPQPAQEKFVNGIQIVREGYQSNVMSPGKNPKRYFYCERCDKTFSSRNGYIIHQRSHTGERPYPCRWCEKAFGDSATRHKHERIHTGERPFKCSRCPRAFNQRAALRAHQVTHTVDRAFLCKYCPSSFPYFATLKRHQQACHNEIACPLCSISTNDAKKLHAHILAKHVDIVQGTITCVVCDERVFTDPNDFCTHMVQHGKQMATNNAAKTRPPIRRRTAILGRPHITIKQEVIDVEPEPQHKPAYEEEPEPQEVEEEQIIEQIIFDDVPVEQVIEQTIVTDDFQIVDGAHSCSLCNAVFYDKDQLQLHIHSEHL